MRCVLGIDSGGSKCHALLVREDGELLGWARVDTASGPVTPVFGGRGRSQEVTREAIRLAVGEHQPEELLITVVGRFLEPFCTCDSAKAVQIHVINEPTAAFTLVGLREGVCVLAGTGAFVHGRTHDGRCRHLDGLGPLLGDRGSGYDIGLRTLQAAARSGWHPRHRTAFSDAVRAACGGEADDVQGISLIPYMAVPRDRSEIARLSRFALAAAAEGDAVALQIVRDAAGALAETICDVVDQLGMAADDYCLVGTGGVIAHSNFYWEHLCGLAQAFAPRLRPLRPECPPVVGVALAGLEQMPGVKAQEARDRLLAGCRARMKREGGVSSPPGNQDAVATKRNPPTGGR